MLVHPALFDEVEDAFGQVEFSDRTLDLLRQEVIQALSGSAIRDRRTLAEALAARGMDDAVAEVLDGALVRSHRLIAPTATLPDLRDTWTENIAVLRPFTVKEQEANARSGAGSLALLARRHSEVGDGAD